MFLIALHKWLYKATMNIFKCNLPQGNYFQYYFNHIHHEISLNRPIKPERCRLWNRCKPLVIQIHSFILTNSWKRRDSCSSGSQMITQVTLSKTYEVCCPGTSDSVGDIQYCCVGSNNDDNKKCDVCFPFCYSSGSDTTTKSSCITKVPVTAADFSDRVASATKTAAMAMATGTATTTTTITTTNTDSSSTASSTFSTHTGSAEVVTAAPALVGLGLVVAMNGVLLPGLWRNTSGSRFISLAWFQHEFYIEVPISFVLLDQLTLSTYVRSIFHGFNWYLQMSLLTYRQIIVYFWSKVARDPGFIAKHLA